jgi:acyl carrier protein
MKEKIENIVKDVVSQYASDNGIRIVKNFGTDTVLFGNNSVIDSIGLVIIVVEVEQRVFDDFNINISLADEKAMSQKNSPFKTIESLSNYINNLLKDQT